MVITAVLKCRINYLINKSKIHSKENQLIYWIYLIKKKKKV